MSEIKQVWGIIKDYKCADLKMVQDPALAVFQHQQAIIDDLKTQLNNMEACYIEKKKQVEELQGRIDEALTWLTRTDIRPINCAREILRGAND
ncbi:hypothetical protein Asch01_01886 [Acinetobacter schindleri]|uniref:hypothetical protein n=1 Tax=Acinetobacter schindleri TaxID=108981 RepID=UPI0030A0A273